MKRLAITVDNIVSVLQQRGAQKIRVEGDEVWCCCPLPHHNDSNPSFSINVAKRVYFCFVCGGGRLETLLRQWGYEVVDAVGTYINDSTIETLSTSIMQMDKPKAKAVHGPLVADLKINKLGRVAQRYLQGRGFDPTSIATLQNVWKVSGEGRGFTASLEFPVSDPNGYLSFTASRRLFGKQRWRYPKGAKKAKTLYGLRHALEEKVENIVVVEGVFDVLKLWKFGYVAVALFGTSASREQIRLLTQFGTVLWLLDGDLAGRVGAVKNWNKLKGYGVAQYTVDIAPFNDPAELTSEEDFERIIDTMKAGPPESGE